MQHFCFYQFNAQLTLSTSRRCRCRCRWRRRWHCLLLVGFVLSSVLFCSALRTFGTRTLLLHLSILLVPLPCALRQRLLKLFRTFYAFTLWVGVAGGRLPVYIYFFFYWFLNFVTCQYRRETSRERESRTCAAAHLNFNLYSL